MTLWLSLAFGAPVSDAVRLFGAPEHVTCMERSNGEKACWGLDLDRATPRALLRPPPCEASGTQLVCNDTPYDWPTPIEQVEGTCVLGNARVFCVGDAWRRWAGQPPNTPKNRPIEVAALAGASRLYRDGRCALVEGRYGCLRAGELQYQKGPPNITHVVGQHQLDADGALWRRGKKVLDGPFTAVAGDFGAEILVRRADGRLLYGRPNSLAEIDVPRSQGGPETLFVGSDRSCAIIAGQVACWGSDRVNQLGDGDGPSLAWGPRVRIPEVFDSDFEPMRCRWTKQTLTCDGDAPWRKRIPGPPIEMDDVEDFQSSDVLGCAKRESGHLHCFGVLGPNAVWPEEPQVRDVAAFEVGRGFGAIDNAGRLHHWNGARNEVTVHGTLEGATQLVSTGLLSCLVSETDMLCADHRGEIRVERPVGTVESRGTDICVVGQDHCLELRTFINDITHSIEPKWVEAAW